MLLKDYFALSYIMTHPIQNHITTRNADFYHMHCYMAPDQIEDLEFPKILCLRTCIGKFYWATYHHLSYNDC